MKKILAGIIYLLVILVSCDISIPQFVNIKGSPGVYFSLGSPLNMLGDDERIENVISTEKIKEMMGAMNGIDAKMYDYMQSDGVQAYLLHYPITAMKLDFESSLGEIFTNDEIKFDIPPFFGELEKEDFGDNGICLEPTILENDDLWAYIQEQTDGEHDIEFVNVDEPCHLPFITIYLEEMARMLKKASNGKFGIEIDYDEVLAETLRMKIPAFGVFNYMYGEDVTVDGFRKLRFYNPDKKEFEPKEDLYEDVYLEIYLNITGPCSGIIEPRVIFEWEEATISTEGMGAFIDYIAIDFSELKGFLGDNQFGNIQGFIFVDGVEENTTKMSLALAEPLRNQNGDPIEPITPPYYLKDEGGIELNNVTLFPRTRPELPDENLAQFDKKISQHSLDEPIRFADVFNSTDPDKHLFYKIDISEFRIHHDNVGGTEARITADLLILFYLELNIKTPVDNPFYDIDDPCVDISNNYVKLDMGLGDIEMGEGDLFGRTPGNDDDLLSNLEYVKIKIINPNTAIFGSSKLALLVTNANTDGEDEKVYADYIHFTKKPELEIKMKDLPNPFTPKFVIMLEKDDVNDDFASLKINRVPPGTPSFDFTIAVEAKANIDIALEF